MLGQLINRLLPLAYRRRRLLAQAPAGPLRNYLAAPVPPAQTEVSAVPYLVLDLETTGLHPQSCEIVSFGWVCIDHERIELTSARHHIVQLQGDMSEASAPIHGITDDACAAGRPLAEVLGELLDALHGRVLIAHRTETELGFIAQACQRVYGAGIVIPAIDTLRIAALDRPPGHPIPAAGALRLGALRRNYHLPRYRAHNALVDALATAELFLAQMAERHARRGPLRLKEFLIQH